MEENYVIWSCTRNKFLKISMVSTYTERLGKKLNCEWYLGINRMILGQGGIGRSTLQEKVIFNLKMCGNANNINVYSKVFAGKRVLSFSNNIFKDGTITEIEIGRCDFEDLHDHQFDIVFKFPDQVVDTHTSQPENSQVSSFKILSEDLQFLLEKEYLCDLTIQCDSTHFKVHKAFLGARSPVFQAMFDSPMIESATNVVAIDDMEAEIVKAMLQFIYSGKTKIGSMSMANSLLYAAEKYQIRGFKNGIITYLKSILSEKNAVQMFHISDMFDETFKTEVLHFVCKHFDKVKNTEEWIDLKATKPALALEVFSHIYS